MPPKIQPRLPKGMRDFLPQTMIKRDYVFGIVRDVFHLYGFEPIQTPVLELYETLMGKYGEDAEKLIFMAQHPGGKEELALRYDLTVPLARYVAMNQNDLTMPFKRYQLAPVWRAERPQRGRYREFYQCDADIVGVAGMNGDAEIVSLIVTALRRLGFDKFTVKINHRQLLTAIGLYAGLEGEPLANLYRSIDKFDKIGAEGVEKEMVERGLPKEVVSNVMGLILSEGAGLEKLENVAKVLLAQPNDSTEASYKAIAELRQLASYLQTYGVNPENYDIDFTMVRGLGYYTGPIFETVITEPNLGSVTGGGRYDDLVGLFRGESLPTTGTSLGIERIIDLMDVLNLYPSDMSGTVIEVFVTVFDEASRVESMRLLSELRQAGIRTDIYLQDKNLGKQFALADKKGIPLVVILGPEEIANGNVKIKRLSDGQEVMIERAQLVEQVKAQITR